MAEDTDEVGLHVCRIFQHGVEKILYGLTDLFIALLHIISMTGTADEIGIEGSPFRGTPLEALGWEEDAQYRLLLLTWHKTTEGRKSVTSGVPYAYAYLDHRCVVQSTDWLHLFFRDERKQ